jgi:hypothetical protein
MKAKQRVCIRHGIVSDGSGRPVQLFQEAFLPKTAAGRWIDHCAVETFFGWERQATSLSRLE